MSEFELVALKFPVFAHVYRVVKPLLVSRGCRNLIDKVLCIFALATDLKRQGRFDLFVCNCLGQGNCIWKRGDDLLKRLPQVTFRLDVKTLG